MCYLSVMSQAGVGVRQLTMWIYGEFQKVGRGCSLMNGKAYLSDKECL